VEETRSHWQQKGGQLFTSQDDDPGLVAAATEELARIDEQFGEEQATAARSDLLRPLAMSKWCQNSVGRKQVRAKSGSS